MNSRQLLIATVAAAAAAAAFAPPAAEARPRRYRPPTRASDSKSKQHIPGRFTTPPTPQNPPDFLGANFDPDDFDQLSVTRGGRMLAYATLISEAGLPGTARQVVLLPEGPGDTSIRITAVGTGDNDQPSVQFDERGYRCVFRSTAQPGGAGASNIQIHTQTNGGAEEAEPETVAVTELDGNDTAFDPSFTARMRVREVGSGVKVRERDAFVAFVSTGDLTAPDDDTDGRNPNHLEQLFIWEEQGKVFRQITDNGDSSAHVNRPSMDKSGFTVFFESTGNLVPDADDPLSDRTGNPNHVRQIFRWRARIGVDQITFAQDGDSFCPRTDATGRFVLFCSRGDQVTGGNPANRLQVFRWTSTGKVSRRLQQLTQHTVGDSALPRPAARPDTFVFWSTAHPPAPNERIAAKDFGTVGTGVLAKIGPTALLWERGKVSLVHGYTDGENVDRFNAGLNPVVTAPPALSNTAQRIFFATNDWKLNPRESGETEEDRMTASPFACFVAMALKNAR